MRRLTAIVIATTAAAGALLVFSDGAVEVLGVWALLILVVSLGLRDEGPVPRPAPPPPPRRPRRAEHLPPRLADLERMVAFSQTLRADFDRRVVPRLRTVADTRLRSDHGVAVDDPHARDLLGPDAWEALHPARRANDGVDEGVTYDEMDALVTAIERLDERS